MAGGDGAVGGRVPTLCVPQVKRVAPKINVWLKAGAGKSNKWQNKWQNKWLGSELVLMEFTANHSS